MSGKTCIGVKSSLNPRQSKGAEARNSAREPIIETGLKPPNALNTNKEILIIVVFSMFRGSGPAGTLYLSSFVLGSAVKASRYC